MTNDTTAPGKVFAAIAAAETPGTTYPEPFQPFVRDRIKRRLGDAGGLDQFGVNLVHLPPGAWSSQRHWHTTEDELVYVLEGELVLITDDGEQAMGPGDCVCFPRNVANGHHLVNRSADSACYLEVGTRMADGDADYPDIDMQNIKRGGQASYVHRNGDPY